MREGREPFTSSSYDGTRLHFMLSLGQVELLRFYVIHEQYIRNKDFNQLPSKPGHRDCKLFNMRRLTQDSTS